MIDLAIGISGFLVKPCGSKRVCENLSTSACSGTPYCSASEIAVANESISPMTVEPSLAIRRKISPGCAVLVEADGDVALVAADLELVGERGALVGQALAQRALHHLRRAAPVRLVHAGRQRLAALAAVAIDRDRLEPELPAVDVGLLDLVDGRLVRHVDGLADGAAR